MKLTVVMVVWMAMLGGPVAAASAAPIFSDDFNRAVSTSIGNGWSETESDAVDVSLVVRAGTDREMQVRDDDPRGVASQHLGISTLGYASIVPAYDRAPSNDTEAGDVLRVEWRDGSNAEGPWTAIASHALADPSGHSPVLQQVTDAGDIADFEFRFRVAVDSNNEGALIGNVMLSGTASALKIQAVPELGSLALADVSWVLLSAAKLGRHAGPTVRVR